MMSHQLFSVVWSFLLRKRSAQLPASDNEADKLADHLVNENTQDTHSILQHTNSFFRTHLVISASIATHRSVVFSHARCWKQCSSGSQQRSSSSQHRQRCQQQQSMFVKTTSG